MQNLIFFKVSVKKKEYKNVALQNSGEASKEVSLCCKSFFNFKIPDVFPQNCRKSKISEIAFFIIFC